MVDLVNIKEVFVIPVDFGDLKKSAGGAHHKIDTAVGRSKVNWITPAILR